MSIKTKQDLETELKLIEIAINQLKALKTLNTYQKDKQLQLDTKVKVLRRELRDNYIDYFIKYNFK